MKPKILFYAALLCTAPVMVKSQTFDWIDHIYSEGGDFVRSIAVDNDENVVAIFGGSYDLTINDVTLESNNSEDLVLAKLGPEGELLWAMRDGGAAVSQYVYDMVIDNQNNIIVAGETSMGSSTFGDYSFDSDLPMAFVAKYNTNGELIWINTRPYSDGINYGTMTTDDDFNIYIAGSTIGGYNFAGDTILPAASYDAFVLKINADGSDEWIRVIGGETGTENFSAVAVDHDGNIILGGRYDTEFSYDGYDFPYAWVLDAFVIKLDQEGSMLWTDLIISEGEDDDPNAIVVDGNNDIFITGAMENYTFFNDDGYYTYTDYNDAMVAKINGSDGEFEWVKNYGGDFYDYAFDLALGANGIFVVGSFTDNFYIGDLAIDGNSTDGFLLTLDWNGDLQQMEQITGNDTEYPTNICVGKEGELFVGGDFTEQIELPNGLNLSGEPGNIDAFVTKYLSDAVAVNQMTESVNSLNIWPVPAMNTLNYDLPVEGLKIIITDLTGKTLTAVSHVNQGINFIDISGLPSGIYQIRAFGINGLRYTNSFLKL